MTKMDMTKFHMIMHQNKNYLLNTAPKLNIRLIGDFQGCVHCDRAKAKQKKIPKQTLEYNEKPGHRMAIDITSCTNKV